MSPFHVLLLVSSALLCAAPTLCSARKRHHGHRQHGKRTSGGLTGADGLGVFDLTHPLTMDTMPVTESGSPIEMILETHDDGMGAR